MMRFEQKYFVFLLILLCCPALSHSQPKGPASRQPRTLTKEEEKAAKKDANVSFATGDFRGALDGYLIAVKSNPKSTEINYRLGFCYVNTNVDKIKAIPYLEYASRQKDAPKNVHYYLGLAYHHANRFDDAIKMYEKYKEVAQGKYDDGLSPDRQIEMCRNGKLLVERPLNVTFENLGKLINSPFPDYNPFISGDESLLVFTSQRKGNVGGFIDEEGKYPADIYMSTRKEGQWTKAKSVGFLINTEWDEESLGLSADGKTLLVYMDNLDLYGDILISTLKGRSWTKPELLGPNVNTKDFETGAAISPDGNVLFFSSSRKEKSFGGSDIYMSKRLPNGDWSIAENLGPVVNTPFDDDAPYLYTDGKTLYFSSKGHNSMGGFDIFKTVYDSSRKTWSRPENIGYPVNTADDNLYFSLSANRRYAYISTVRPNGLGDLDIYKVTFNDVEYQNFSVIKGFLATVDSLPLPVAVEEIILNDKNNHQFIGTYKPTAKKTFVMIVTPGTYEVTIQADGYAILKEEISIPAYKQPFEVPRTFYLKKL